MRCWTRGYATTRGKVVRQRRSSGRKGRALWRRLLSNFNVVLGLIVVGAVVITAAVAPHITPKDPLEQNIWMRYRPPDARDSGHVLGTDELGRDVFSRIIMGTRVSLLVGVVATGISLLAGMLLGAAAGFMGRTFDEVIMRFMDVILSLPGLLLAIAIVSVLGPSVVNAMLAIAIVRVPAMARVVRSQVLSLKEQQFTEAALAIGCSRPRVLLRHIMVNAWAPAMVLATLGMGTAIVTEASLSFLGLGTQPPLISWGRMLSVGREAIRTAPHVTLYPGLAIAITVLGFNLLGEGLRDVFDPHLRGR